MAKGATADETFKAFLSRHAYPGMIPPVLEDEEEAYRTEQHRRAEYRNEVAEAERCDREKAAKLNGEIQHAEAKVKSAKEELATAQKEREIIAVRTDLTESQLDTNDVLFKQYPHYHTCNFAEQKSMVEYAERRVARNRSYYAELKQLTEVMLNLENNLSRAKADLEKAKLALKNHENAPKTAAATALDRFTQAAAREEERRLAERIPNEKRKSGRRKLHAPPVATQVQATWRDSVPALSTCPKCLKTIRAGGSVFLGACTHAVCSDCATQARASGSNVECALCGEPSAVAAPTTPHPLVELVLQREHVRVRCQYCSDSLPADVTAVVLTCTDCDTGFCEIHALVHGLDSEHRGHTVKRVPHSAWRCTVHDQPFEAYCESDAAVVCLACLATLHPPETHRTMLLTGPLLTPRCARVLKEVAAARELAAEHLCRAMDARLMEAELTDRHGKVAKEVGDSFDTLEALVALREATLLSSAAALSAAEVTAFRLTEEAAHAQWVILSSAIDVAELVVSSPSSQDYCMALAQLEPLLNARLQKLSAARDAAVAVPAIKTITFSAAVDGAVANAGTLLINARARPIEVTSGPAAVSVKHKPQPAQRLQRLERDFQNDWHAKLPDLIACTVCIQIILTGDSVLLTACLHAICRRCLVAMREHDHITCGVCQIVSTLPEPMPTSHLWVEATAQRREVPKCSECHEHATVTEAVGVMTCVDCARPFCEVHGLVHVRTDPFHGHVLKPVVPSASSRCAAHGKPLEAYCHSDSTVLCLRCLASTHLATAPAERPALLPTERLTQLATSPAERPSFVEQRPLLKAVKTGTAESLPANIRSVVSGTTVAPSVPVAHRIVLLSDMRARLSATVITARSVASAYIDRVLETRTRTAEITERDKRVVESIRQFFGAVRALFQERKKAFLSVLEALGTEERKAFDDAQKTDRQSWRVLTATSDLAAALASAESESNADAAAVLVHLEPLVVARLQKLVERVPAMAIAFPKSAEFRVGRNIEEAIASSGNVSSS